jgi:hypothetical protein
VKIQHCCKRGCVEKNDNRVLKGIQEEGGKEKKGKRKGRTRMLSFNAS